jgi:uncharacterized protein with FMN-binding domain
LRRVIFAIVATAAALIFLLSFKTHTTPVAAVSPPSASASPASGAGASAAATSKSTAASGTSSGSARSGSASSAAKTVTGDEAQTIYGPIQVKITVKNGKVTAADATEYPNNDPRDAQINAYAIPALNSEAVSAGSAQIDSVSGATYTSRGYVSSLQSALDKAGL